MLILKLINKNKQNISSLLNTGLGAFFEAIIIFLVLRSFSKSSFGLWIIYITSISLIEYFRSGFIGNAITKYLSAKISTRQRNEIIGSGLVISLLFTVIISFLCFILYFTCSSILPDFILLFLRWYPFYGLSLLPLNLALPILHAEQRYLYMLILRGINYIGYIIFLLINLFGLNLSIVQIIIGQILIYSLGSCIAIVTGKAYLNSIKYAKKSLVLDLLHFGKYSAGTTIGSNLLRSSDTFIIGLLMTKVDVSLYSIPLKLIEALNIPLQSFTAVAYPLMSKAAHDGDKKKLLNIFYKYAGITSVIFIPILLILFIFAPQIIVLYAGEQYIENDIPVLVFKIFLLFGFFVTIDRFTGTALDSLNLPKYNFHKVCIMVFFNVIGDIAALYYFKSLLAVASVTVLTVILGVYLGLYYLNNEVDIKLSRFVKVGLTVKNK